MTRFKAVLFDFDGVLGRTMEDNYSAWKSSLADVGIPLAKEDYFLLEGISTRELARQMLEKHGKDTGLAEAVAKKKDQNYLNNNSFSLYEGAAETVRKVKDSGYKTALVTAASHGRLTKTLPATLLGAFECVITADKIARGKPFPDPYLAAAAELSVRPEECAVIENAPVGIQAAKSAGMFCVAITSTLDAKHLAKADRIVGDISGIFGAIEG